MRAQRRPTPDGFGGPPLGAVCVFSSYNYSTSAMPQKPLCRPGYPGKAPCTTWYRRLVELRAAVSLGRLWRQQGHGERARALVAQVYAWFTAGCNIVDLQQMRALT